MKNQMITFFILIVSMTLVNQVEAQGHHSHHDSHQYEAPGSHSTDEFQAEFAVFMQNYFDLKEALVDSDLEKARHNSHAMGDQLEEIGPHRLEGDEHMFWMNRFEDLSDGIAAIHNAGSLADAREYFSSLSDQLVEIVGILDMDGSVYHQFCPMADAGWLSDEEEIRNPYMPDTMLGCGRVERQLGS